MDAGYAMTIKTTSYHQTELAKKLREVIKATGTDVVLVPHGVTDLFITVEDDRELTVILQSSNHGYDCTDLDIVKGFDSIDECWQYARVVMTEAGLSNDSCDSDVWEKVE
jgi:PHP family Zn ribbon phosphoesterase